MCTEKQTGFSLIELMVVVAIIGILATIAIPSYQDYVLRGKVVEATNQLSGLRTRLEKFYQDERNYGAGNVCGVDGGGVTRVRMPVAPEARFFAYACVTDGQTYTLTATGAAGEGLGGLVYTLNEANLRRTTTVPAGWAGAGSNCWVAKRDGSC